ncbi:RNA polymerase sigma-70 factor, ECF subfamily [Paenibacillus sophorae]|uniref:RNA polymerase sigma-70 factor, ECF subfamily n=1 Tax=Paenibacillus sophorae TaxID=1333845 RepID=A0A1H8LGS5_9BACL|nr:sigma-70 family RNA polymerase sigma factor [Paenibacillus sophorae]QWU17296.1 sigma-70 family RNA polymerase sigma factor [Paenibacillus sophorae]SEO04259.1 RNA polymerase sigma-70 factor, ECF subfamily [Paenibacillus sophorae]
MNHPKQDSELAALVLAGSHEAYSELYERTITEVYRTVRFLIGESSDTDDVVQEIYIQMYRSLGQYDTTRPFRPWLMGVVMRQIRAYRRKRWNHIRLIKKAQHSITLDHDFSGEVVDKVSYRPLIASVERLPFKLKQVVILHYLNEYSQEEIADTLGIPLGTVKSRIHAALTKLRSKRSSEILLRGKVEDLHEA